MEEGAGDRQVAGRCPLDCTVNTLTITLEFLVTISVAARHVIIVTVAQLGAEIRLDAEELRQLREAAARIVGHDADVADAGLEVLGDEDRGGIIGVLREIAHAELAGRGDVEVLVAKVERQAGAQVDLAAGAAFDEVSGRGLIDVDGAHQLGRNVAPQQRAAAIGAEDFTTVQARRDARQATHLHAGTLRGKVVRIIQRREAHDRHARNALEHFGDRIVGQLARVIGDDRVDDCLTAALAIVGSLKRSAAAGDDDLFATRDISPLAGRFLSRIGCALRLDLRIGRQRGARHGERQRGSAQPKCARTRPT